MHVWYMIWCGWRRGSYHVEVHIWSQLLTCKYSSGYLKPKTDPDPVKEVHRWSERVDGGRGARYCNMSKPSCVMGHAIRTAMGTVWETWGVWPSCEAIWYHQSPGTYHHMIMPLPTPSRLQNTTALMTPSFSHPAPNPPVNAPCIDAVSTAIDRSYVSGHWHYSRIWPPLSKQCSSSCSTCLQILICTASSAVTKGKPEERHGKEYARTYKNTPAEKKMERKVWRIFNFGEKSNSIGEGGERSVAAAESPASCQESGSNPQTEDKTSFSLWLNHWWIILLFRRVLLACRGKVKSFFW